MLTTLTIGAATTFTANAQEHITKDKDTGVSTFPELADYTPNSGFPGDTITVTGTNLLSTVQTIKIGAAEAEIISESTDTEMYFVVPEYIEDDVKDSVTFITKDGRIRGSHQEFLYPKQFSDAEILIMHEPFEDAPYGGGTLWWGVDGNQAAQELKHITYSGGASRVWFGGQDKANYEGGSARAVYGMKKGQSITISGIDTEGLENIRLSFGTAYWGWLQLDGALKLYFSENGGEFKEFGGGSMPYSVGGTLEQVRVGYKLPSTPNLSLKWEVVKDVDNHIFIDDVKVTGYPAGAAQISGFEPQKQKVGKSVQVLGSSLTNVSKVWLGEIEVTEFETSQDGKSLSLVVPFGADAVGRAQVLIERTEGGNVTSVDNLDAMAAEPYLESFSPASGPVGGLIYLHGDNLYNISSIKFGDVDASEFMSLNDSVAEVYVPEGAITAPVSIMTENYEKDTTSMDDFVIDLAFPIITITSSESEVMEGDVVEIKLTTSAGAISETKVMLEVSGEGISDDDYDLDKSELTIAKDASESDMATLSILEDSDDFEEDETLTLTMASTMGDGAVIGETRSVSILIKAPTGPPTSIDLEKALDKLKVHAVNNQLSLFVDNKLNINNAQVSIYNAEGRINLVSIINVVNGRATLNAQNLQRGVYIIRLNTGNEILTGRFIHQ